MKLRDSILIQPNAIGSEEIEFLMKNVRQAQMVDSLVSSFGAEARGEMEWVVDRETRDTQEVQLPRPVVERLSRLDAASILAFINPFYNVEVQDGEPSQILHYGVGGHYIPHVDSETPFRDDTGLEMWEKTLDRDLSLVYFLNDDFAGGELVFPELDLAVKPKAGTLVCFPSDHNYVHGVKPVTAGHRYTIVTWMRVKGMPSMDEINQMALDEYHRMWPKQIEQSPRLKKGGMR